MENALETATSIIREVLSKNGFTVEKIILFGSRARGDYQEDSDWDLLVVIDKAIEFQEKKRITARIQRKLAEHRIPNDIILKPASSFFEDKEIVGNISYFAAREGIEI